MGSTNSKFKNLEREIRSRATSGSSNENTIDFNARYPMFTSPAGSIPSMPSMPTSSNQQTRKTYKTIEGREFKALGNPKYMLPGDNEELDRLLIAHYAVRFLFQGNFRAPVKKALENGIQVLDVGCGPGSWTLEMATDYPDSDFHGIDIAEVFPTDIIPRNVKFSKVNVTKGLPFGDNSFDLVFQRSMLMSYSEQDWPNVIKELIRITKPGGWIELLENDLLIHDAGEITTVWFNYFAEGLKARGIEYKVARRLDKLLRAEPAMTNINKLYYSSPMGWGQDKFGGLGELLRQNSEMSFRSLKPVICLALGIAPNDYDEMAKTAMEELVAHKSWSNYFAVWAQKKVEVDGEMK